MTVIYSTHGLHPKAEAMLAEAGKFRVAGKPDKETILAEATNADIVIVRAPLPEALFERAMKLKAAIRHGAGLDMIPLGAATAAGVLVANVPGANAVTVAEHVLFAALALLRRFRAMDGRLRAEGWNAGRALADSGRDLTGRTIGIVGFGNIGRRVQAMAAGGFGLASLVHSRRIDDLPDNARFVGLDELMGASDIVVLCCPLTPETHGMIDARRIGLMKRNAVLINVARGPVVDDDALIAALREGRIGGAGLDVFSQQPLPADHPYFGFDNVIVTPHIAGITQNSMERMGTGAAEEALRVLAGEMPVNLCNPAAVEAYRRRFA